MTDIEALEYSIEMWNWLVDNPDKGKEDLTYTGESKWWTSCSLCSYDELFRDDCEKCPMYKRWPGSSRLHGECQSKTWTAFDEYDRGNHSLYDRAFFAMVLVEAFEKRLRELKS